MKPRLLLADENQLLLDGLRKLLEPDFAVVGMVFDGRAAVAAFEQLRPDVMLLEIGLPVLNGIEVARQVRRTFPDARIIFVTMHSHRTYVDEAFYSGASGYCVKQGTASELLEAIRTVMHGERYVSTRLRVAAGANAGGESPATKPAPKFGGKLTQRQREVLQLIAEGKSMKEIARILDISVRTVEFHKNGLVQQLGLRTIAELTRYALDQKIAV